MSGSHFLDFFNFKNMNELIKLNDDFVEMITELHKEFQDDYKNGNFIQIQQKQPDVEFMPLSEIKESDWYKQLPEIIQTAVGLYPPAYYKLKDSGKRCYILNYEEPESGLFEDITVTVKKTGERGVFGFSQLDTNAVFGIKLEDLLPD